MLVRGLFALLIFLPYWFLVPDRPWWLTLLVGLGAVGVAIDPAVTPGVRPAWNATISALPVLRDPFSGRKVLSMTRKFFKNRFADASGRICFQR